MEIDETTAIGDASAAAEAWLAHVDAGDREAGWRATSSLFRRLVGLPQWEEAAGRVESVFGRPLSRWLTESRYTTTVPGAPDGHYVLMEYAAGFERKKEAVETVVAMLDEDGAWRVGGYFVR